MSLRGEKYRDAITADVEMKITLVQTAREMVRSFLDDQKACFFGSTAHRYIYIYIRSIVLNKEPANSDPKTITKQYSSVKWVRPHIFLFKPESLNDIPRHYFPSSTWKVDMLPQATTDLKAALDEMDSAMLPAKKAKAPAPKSAAKES